MTVFGIVDLAARAVSNDNDGTTFTVATGGPLTRGNTSDGYEFGIRHAF